MNPTQNTDASGQTTPPRPKAAFRRCCKYLLLVLLALPAMVILFYSEEKLRGSFMWQRSLAKLESQGVKLRLMDLAHPPIPDGSNFAYQPALAPLFDFKPGTQEWVDTNGYQKLRERKDSVKQMASKMGFRNFPEIGRAHV